MTTQPPTRSPVSGPAPHTARQMAESFGVDAERYDRTRPSYPDEMVARIVAASPGPDVLDVGCGTGTAARQFQAAGCRVLGVDPDARMAGFARRRGLAVEVARFEDWDPAGRTFDLVIAGTAWHWVDPAAGAAKAARVLRPGGRLAAFWHVAEPPSAVSEALGAALRRALPDAPVGLGATAPRSAMDGYRPMFAAAADGIRKADGFDEPEEWHFTWEREYTRDEWLDLVPTSGGHHLIPRPRLDELLAGLGEVVDAAGGRITVGYATVLLTATRTESR